MFDPNQQVKHMNSENIIHDYYKAGESINDSLYCSCIAIGRPIPRAITKLKSNC